MILAFGILLLLFVAFELWGTGISTHFHQEQLRQEFNRELARANRSAATTTTSNAGHSTTPTTLPLRGVVQPVPGDVPADGQPIGTIVIPNIGVNFVVVEGTSVPDLKLGPGHYAGTPLPGQPGNAAIAGHRTTYLAPFSNINELQTGDPIYITTVQGRFEYQVTRVFVVSPSDNAVLAASTAPELTLTTCNPRYSASQRLVVQASLVTPPGATTTPSTTTTTPSSGTRAASGALRSNSLAGDGTSAWGAVSWGAACFALAFGLRWLARRSRRWMTRLAYLGIGGLALLVLLFFFFESLSPLLPASY